MADKPLPVDARLARVLKNMPAVWLDAACAAWGIAPARGRLNDPSSLDRHKYLSMRVAFPEIVL